MRFEYDIRHAEQELRHRVIAALGGRPEASRIGVSVTREVVTLEGQVGSLEARRDAEEIVSSVQGVSAVVNDLRIDGASWRHPIVEHILVPIDLSEERVGALRYARLFAEKLGSRVTVLYADPLEPRPGQEAAYADRLDRTVRLYADPHLDPYPFQVAFESGDPAAAILREVQRSRCDLIVMGTSTREKRGHEPSRSVAVSVVRHSTAAVLTVDEDDYPPVQRGLGVTAIVCPVNLTPVARQALQLAAKLAGVFHAHLYVVRVVEPGEHTELAHEEGRLSTWLGVQLPGPELAGVRPYRVEIVRGDAPGAILDALTRFDADLLVLGAQHGAHAGVQTIGATSERLLRSATVPVLVVPRA